MKHFTKFATLLCIAFAMATGTNAQDTKTWDFTKISTVDREAIEANIKDSGKDWEEKDGVWFCKTAIGQNSKNNVALSYADIYKETATKPLYSNPAVKPRQEAEYTKGLHFGIWINGDETTPAPTKAIYKNLKIQHDKNTRLLLNAKNIIIVIPALKKGYTLEVTMAGNSDKEPHTLEAMNVTSHFKPQEQNFNMKFLRRTKVKADGNVVLRSTDGGIYVYDITVKDEQGQVLTKEQIGAVHTAVSTVKPHAETTDRNIYTLEGKRVGTHLDALPHGIYVVNGKKVAK